MKFDEFLSKIENGFTFEQLANGTNVECFGNIVYEDDDLYNFLEILDAQIVGYGANDQSVIIVADNKRYCAPCKFMPNRFDDSLSDEIVIFFDKCR